MYGSGTATSGQPGAGSLVIVVGIVCALLVIIIHYLRIFRRTRQRAFLRDRSSTIAGLDRLNASFAGAFWDDVASCYSFPHDVNSKRQFDQLDPYEFMVSVVSQMSDDVSDWVGKAQDNASVFREYKDECGRLLAATRVPERLPRLLFGSPGTYLELERTVFADEMLDPTRETSIELVWSYTSPKGQNSYRDARTFTQPEVESMLAEVERNAAYEQTTQYQRALMTPSLRYDVMRRDGFRCCICGRSAREGVKLEVDHIVPVAKGGATVMDNLQTLCWDCNRGKRDKLG